MINFLYKKLIKYFLSFFFKDIKEPTFTIAFKKLIFWKFIKTFLFLISVIIVKGFDKKFVL